MKFRLIYRLFVHEVDQLDVNYENRAPIQGQVGVLQHRKAPARHGSAQTVLDLVSAPNEKRVSEVRAREFYFQFQTLMIYV